jgi:hypothetical protein
MFGGQYKDAARQAYAVMCAELRGKGPAIYAELISYGKDAWVFQRTIAETHGCCVRTVQRWLRRFRELGLLVCHRAKKREVPKGALKPLNCGWSHRILTEWHHVGQRFRARCEELAQKHAAKVAARNAGRRRYTAEELDRELVKRYGPDPPTE